jgi:hypothetical protein
VISGAGDRNPLNAHMDYQLLPKGKNPKRLGRLGFFFSLPSRIC